MRNDRPRRIPHLLLVLALAVPALARADEGMWTIDNLPLERMQKDIGFAPDAAWRDRVMRGAARLANGCSASFVSKDGLVLSNHHCVVECLGQISSEKKDYIADGFLARTRAEEHACPAMEVDRLEAITDVTADVKGATSGKEGTAFQKAYDAATSRITNACVGKDGDRVRCDVVDLYHGGEYKLYRYRRYQDTRLVFAPEQATAFFGGDPDNFNFPRFDLDMSIVRVYEDGHPAAIRDYFPLNAAGPSAGEPVFVVGHPGATQRQLTTDQLADLRDRELPDRLFRLYELRGVIEQYRTEGPEPWRIGTDDIFSIENSIKALRGRFEALTDPGPMDTFRKREQALRARVAKDAALAPAAGAWDEIARATEAYATAIRPTYLQVEAGRAFLSDYFTIARDLVRGAAERPKPDGERLAEFHDSARPQLEAHLFSPAPIYPAYEKVKLAFSLTKMREALGADAALVHQILGKDSPEQVAARLVDGTKLGDIAVRRALWEGGAEAVARSDDPFIRLAREVDAPARAIRARYEGEVHSRIQKAAEQIAKARFAANGTGEYPDATFTLRLSYGTVRGWKEGEGEVPPFTNLGGAFARATGAPPFALPRSWLAAHDRIDLAKPFNLVSNNDIIGGNSGSPMLNRKGELVGLVFDGNIHSLGGAFWFDPVMNRTVAVDSAAILEAMGRIYDARELQAELAGQPAPR